MSQPDPHPLLDQLHQHKGKKRIQCGRSLDIPYVDLVAKRWFIPRIQQHMPQVTDGNAVFGEWNSAFGILRIRHIWKLEANDFAKHPDGDQSLNFQSLEALDSVSSSQQLLLCFAGSPGIVEPIFFQ